MSFIGTVITVTPNESEMESASRLYKKGEHAALGEGCNEGSIVSEPADAETYSQGVGVAAVTWFAGRSQRKMHITLVLMDNIWGPL